MKKVLIGVIGATSILLSTAGMAGQAVGMNNTQTAGLYVGGNVGYGFTNVSNAGLSNIRRNGIAWSAFLGYQFNRYLALEGGYNKFAPVKFSIPGIRTEAHLHAFDLALKGIYPINQSFSVFAKVGAAVMQQKLKIAITAPVFATATVRTTRVTPLFAIGSDINLSQNLALEIQGQTTLKTGPIPATYTATVGLSYKFPL